MAITNRNSLALMKNLAKDAKARLAEGRVPGSDGTGQFAEIRVITDSDEVKRLEAEGTRIPVKFEDAGKKKRRTRRNKKYKKKSKKYNKKLSYKKNSKKLRRTRRRRR